jgi:hypothetical protein
MNTGTRTLILATLLAAAGCSSEVGGGGAPLGSAAPPGAALPGAVDPITGLPLMPAPAATDPVTGLPLAPTPSMPVDPANPAVPGMPRDPANPAVPVDPANPANPADPVDPIGPVGPGLPPEPLPECNAPIPGTTQIPRLTAIQYNRTMRDLLGVTSSPASLLATESAGVMTSLAWAGYQNAADTVAAEVMADPTLKANFMKCTPAGDGAACLTETVAEFGRRAFRRRLTAEETAGFQAIIADGAAITASGTPDEVAEVILSVFLMAPAFLQRAEIAETPAGSAYQLSSHEVAARLSYTLWGSMPDEELDAVADADMLQTKEQILTQAQRMVADPKTRDVAADFHRVYLHLSGGSRWDSARKEAEIFSGFEALIPDLIGETEALFDGVFAAGGTFQDLLTTNAAYVTSQTAPLYGLESSAYGSELTRVELTDGTRPGFLTRAGFLAAYSGTDRTSPILRGAFILKDVLGIDPGAPDPAAAMTPLPPIDATIDTNRKQVEKQTEPASCAGCHETFVNPPGFVMEAFDTTGAAQTTERSTGAPIDTVADVRYGTTGTPETTSTPAEMMAKIAAALSAQRHYAEKWTGFAYQRVLAPRDDCTLDALGERLTTGRYTIQNLLRDLTQTDSFQTRALEVTQ